ncbi:MAG: alpha-ketoacid dehydrogenase subunit beta [Lachnospiraceae bacterium]|nr:alpha-ketoacid dehydrogenase subunit beta [Lachnospiraceae bacterium]
MRRGFLKRIDQMIKNEQDTVFFTVDIGMWAIRDILSDYPERAMNVGIYEDGMFSIAAGLASGGLVPTIFGIQPYLVERTLEQIKLDFAYQRLGVNVVGTGAAVDYSKYGYSHYCAEDAGVLKMIPEVEMVTPGTAEEFLRLFNQTYRNGHPTFFRISDHPNKKYDLSVEFGKASVIQKGTKATVIAVSIMLDDVMEVCEGEDVTVLYYTTLAPFDGDALKNASKNGKILICEPHFSGALDYDILQTMEGEPVQIRHVGFPREIFRNYGNYVDKMNYYGVNARQIRQELGRLLAD